jgi:hypothetical protein
MRNLISIPRYSSDPLGARGAELYGGPTISSTMVLPHGPPNTSECR